MKNVLVLGGTRFFGKKLIKKLLHHGMNVTITTRGNVAHPFGDQVNHIIVDREDRQLFQKALGSTEWDVVYDNICYAPNEAEAACEIFKDNVKRYVLTSTLSVYDLGEEMNEDIYNPFTQPIRMGSKEEMDYQEGKRLTEAVFIQRASFPVVAMRIPIVLGMDDYTERLKFHVEHIKNGKPLEFNNLDARMSFISSDEVADFLYWLGHSSIDGPINGASEGTISMGELLQLIENTVGKKSIVQSETEQEHKSPFAVPESYYMDTAKARDAGYTFSSLYDWLPRLIEELATGN